MASRITLAFAQAERAALEELARREYRDVRQQAGIIIRRELERLGLLAAPDEARSDIKKEECHES